MSNIRSSRVVVGVLTWNCLGAEFGTIGLYGGIKQSGIINQIGRPMTTTLQL